MQSYPLTTNNNRQKIRVLVVDDEPFVRRSISEILCDDGYEVTEAPNAMECLTMLEQQKFDIVLLDIQMPDRDGLETFKEISMRHYRVKTIIISGHGTIETAVDAIRRGAFDFIEKPFCARKLRASVKNAAQEHNNSRIVDRTKDEGTLIGGKYLIEKEISSGATATVYRAVHKELGKTIALKILRHNITKNGSFDKRFIREARIMAQLCHPNIVEVFDFGIDKSYFLAMEFVEGKTLAEYLTARGPLSDHECGGLAIEICKALEHAHSLGIIHRDIKPQNVLISNSGHIKLTDFGLAHCLYAVMEPLTCWGETLGTPQFMSAEQIEGEKLDCRSDIFSLGVLLYLAVTMRYPFSGSNLAEVLSNIVRGEFIEPSNLNPSVGAQMNKLIVTCLNKNREKRFASATQMRKALQQIYLHHSQKQTDSQPFRWPSLLQ